MPDALFDVPDDAYVIAPAPEKVSRTQARHRLVARRIASGEHPLGWPLRLHPSASRDPDDHETGLRCGSCRYRVLQGGNHASYPKCLLPTSSESSPTGVRYLRNTGSEASDIRAWWPACTDHQPKED